MNTRVGETFEIPLEGVPTAGFTWEVILPPAAAERVVLLEQAWDRPSSRVGGRAVQRFRFRAVGPGDVVLTFRYRRRWQKAKPRGERVITLHIAE
jgi:predicted secreted protein